MHAFRDPGPDQTPKVIRKSPFIWHGLARLARLACLAGLAVRNLRPLIFPQNFYIATIMS
jgi:hypothetical protein